MNRYFGRIGVAIASFTLVAGFAAADGITIPKGTAVDLVLADPLNSKTLKVGDTFRATFQRALYVDGLPALAQGTPVRGRVEAVRSLGDGAKSGFISVSFDRITVGGADAKEFEGKLTSLRQDDRRRIVELAPKVSTGRKIDVVLIGHSTTPDNRAHTLVGDDLAPDYAITGLSATEVEVVVGTVLSMEFDEAMTVSALDVKGAAASEARLIHPARPRPGADGRPGRGDATPAGRSRDVPPEVGPAGGTSLRVARSGHPLCRSGFPPPAVSAAGSAGRRGASASRGPA